MSAEPLTALLRFPLLLVLLLLWSGCATAPDVAVPVATPAPAVPLPAFSRVLGEATVYVSAAGERVEVVHDDRAGIAIVKLPDGGAVVLPAEIAGSEGRYRDSRMTVWENDGGLLLWVEGKLVFSGRIEK
jgi:membrane-bound inhibitor of C-type lysozyme